MKTTEERLMDLEGTTKRLEQFCLGLFEKLKDINTFLQGSASGELLYFSININGIEYICKHIAEYKMIVNKIVSNTTPTLECRYIQKEEYENILSTNETKVVLSSCIDSKLFYEIRAMTK